MNYRPFTRFMLARLVLGNKPFFYGEVREELAVGAELDMLAEGEDYEQALIEFARRLRPAFQRCHFGNLPEVDIVGLNITQEAKSYKLWIHRPGALHVSITSGRRNQLRPEVQNALLWLADPQLNVLSIDAGKLFHGLGLDHSQIRELGSTLFKTRPGRDFSRLPG